MEDEEVDLTFVRLDEHYLTFLGLPQERGSKINILPTTWSPGHHVSPSDGPSFQQREDESMTW